MSQPDSPSIAIDQQSSDLDDISQQLVDARAKATALTDFPGQLPETLEDAYTIQSASIARWPDDIGGWKVGMVPDSYRQRLAAERLAGPIFRSSIDTISTGATGTMSIFTGGFAAVEAEFVLELATTIEPSDRDYSHEELAELVSAIHAGAEIASSPMAFVNKLGPCCVVSDFGNNAGLLIGPSVPDWRAVSFEELEASVTVDGVVVGSANASAIEGGLMQALRFLIASCAKRGITLPEGTLVSSGAVTGIHEITVESQATLDFGSLGAFNVAFAPMQPTQ